MSFMMIGSMLSAVGGMVMLRLRAASVFLLMLFGERVMSSGNATMSRVTPL